VPLATWQDIFVALRSRGLDAFFVAMETNLAALEVFDGLHSYGVGDKSNLPALVATAGDPVRFYSVFGGSLQTKLAAATVQPGYDERLLANRAGKFIEREDGAIYRATWEAAIAADPDWIFIATWNEFWENTHIEPSTLYGDFYLRLTGEYAARWKTGGPSISPAGIVNGATFDGGALAPGEIITVFGSGLGPASLVPPALNSAGRVASVLADTRVRFDGIAAPLIYTQSRQLAAIVPYSVAGNRDTQVQIEYQGVRSNLVTLPVADCAPGIFTANSSGTGQGAVLNADATPNSARNPTLRGSIVSLFATGAGQTEPPGIDGMLAAEPLPRPRLPVSVLIGGVRAELLYAGAAPGLVAGVLQVNVRVPPETLPGDAVPVVLTCGSASSPAGVTLAIR
jgi:uncharacterized protein (TIGR03437 family)